MLRLSFRMFSLDEADAWDSLVRSFPHWDVYYLSAYARSFSIHGDGVPYLVFYENDGCRVCFVVMQQDISTDPRFAGAIPAGAWYDWSTPYGYGGPLVDGTVNAETERDFSQQLHAYCRAHHIVSLFVRFHPLLLNHACFPNLFECRYMHDTIAIDTGNPETIARNMDSACRNKVRKAKKNGVVVRCRPVGDMEAFRRIYEDTMTRDHANDYYFFGSPYFSAQKALADHACLFYAYHEDQPIAGTIIYYNDEYMHYHLSGSLTAYRKFAAINLLLYEVAVWGAERGIQRFHLGGGMAPDDNLFGFKKQFNKNGRCPFHIGRVIFDAERYQRLIEIRKERDVSFDEENSFMIQYRR